MSETFHCHAEDKFYEAEGGLQPITICSDCYFDMTTDNNLIAELADILKQIIDDDKKGSISDYDYDKANAILAKYEERLDKEMKQADEPEKPDEP